MKDYRIVSADELDDLFDEEEACGRTFLDWRGEKEIDGLLYTFYYNERNGETIARRMIRSVHMGFNSNEEGKLEEFVEIVEREGVCEASWGVTGRTAHLILAQRLSLLLPQYRFENDYNYRCVAYKN